MPLYPASVSGSLLVLMTRQLETDTDKMRLCSRTCAKPNAKVSVPLQTPALTKACNHGDLGCSIMLWHSLGPSSHSGPWELLIVHCGQQFVCKPH